MYKTGSRPESRSSGTWTTSWHPSLRRIPWLTLSVIAAGGVIGALARQGLWVAFPHHPGAFDWTTLGSSLSARQSERQPGT
jgi:hypothetical protein